MLQHLSNLFQTYGGEIGQEVINAITVAEVQEQVLHRHSGSPEHPSPVVDT